MPSIQYQFRVNSDADGFLFESLENVPANQRSAFIREKLVIGILASANVGFKPAPSVTQAENKPVLPTTPEAKASTNGFEQSQIVMSPKQSETDPPVVGNTKAVLPLPRALSPSEIIRQRKAEAAAKLNHPTPEVTKKG